MTAFEDRLRRAIRAKAEEIPPDAVPPLRLPDQRRRFFSLAYGGGEREGAPARRGWRGWLAPASSAVLVAAMVAGSGALSHLIYGGQSGWPGQGAAATGNKAAAWVAAQVSRSARVSCDPVMCRALETYGIDAGDLDELRPGSADPLGSEVIVATAAVRSEFGGRLSSVYAPAVIASFGSGSAQIEVRVIAQHGAAEYRSALSADLAVRKAAGTELSGNDRIVVSAAARRQLWAGQVDSRLLTTIATMATLHRVFIVAFGDSGPSAGAAAPLRSVELAGTGNAHRMGGSADLQQMLGFLHAQRAPYLPARAEMVRLPGGRPVLRVEFAAPSPLGLLSPAPTQVRGQALK